MSSTVDAVYTFANAVHNYFEENCNFTSGWTWENQRCPGQRRELNGSTLLEYLSSVDFINPFTEDRVTFDNNGSAPGRYEILYQAQLSNGIVQYGLQRVGTWSISRMNRSEPLKIFDNVTLQFGVNKSGRIVFYPPVTQCGRYLQGEYLRPFDSCRGICELCLGRNHSDDPTAPSCKKMSSDKRSH